LPRAVDRIFALAVFAGALMGAAEAAEPLDPHALFEQRCGRCHGHAGELARDKLAIVGDTLRGRSSGQELVPFLRRHGGGVNTAEAAALLDMFTRQVEAGGLFQERCRICHDPASGFARRTLIIDDDGRLRGRYTGNDIAEFLARHGRLRPEAIDPVVRMLRWQLESAGRG
jgi:hypothetical protein